MPLEGLELKRQRTLWVLYFRDGGSCWIKGLARVRYECPEGDEHDPTGGERAASPVEVRPSDFLPKNKPALTRCRAAVTQ